MSAPAPHRAESQEFDFRPEPTFTRPQAQSHDDLDEHDMGSMSRAITEITQKADHHHHHTYDEPKKSTSLFDRLRNKTKISETVRQPELPARAPATEAPPRFGGMEARREPMVATHSDDLDIPAFLRRQAN
jgi:hypothetical protein